MIRNLKLWVRVKQGESLYRLVQFVAQVFLRELNFFFL